MTERELLIDCLRRLNRTGVTYMLTGSMASNYWGIPRTTHDLDFVIQLPPSAVGVLMKEFTPDFYLDEQAIRAAYQPPHQFNAIDTRSALKVDFWLPRGTAFETEMFRRRVQKTLFSERAWIATAEDTLLHKLYWDKLTPSERQRGDAAGIMAVQRGNLDLGYMRRWAADMKVEDTLDALISGQIKPKQT
jgi:hypothetical protein